MNTTREKFRDDLSLIDGATFRRYGHELASCALIMAVVLQPVLLPLQVETHLACTEGNCYMNSIVFADNLSLIVTSNMLNEHHKINGEPSIASYFSGYMSDETRRSKLALDVSHNSCGGLMTHSVNYVSVPPVICLECFCYNPGEVWNIGDHLHLMLSSGRMATYQLVCVIYYGHHHFVSSHLIDGAWWSYDGMLYGGGLKPGSDTPGSTGTRPAPPGYTPALLLYLVQHDPAP